MKLKQHPDDFFVEEITTRIPSSNPADGSFCFYRLEKTGWTTPDALAALRRRWNLDLRRLSYGGLKDRHARTIQYLTIHRGPERNLQHHGFEVTYLGRLPSAYTSADITCNRFAIVLRNLTADRRERAEQRLHEVAQQGIPNYFDDQRFGSISSRSQEFMAKHLVLGNFEEALKLVLTAPYDHDLAEQKKEKQLLRDHWGDWALCKERLGKSHARSLVDYLRVHPGDFKGAIVRLRPELRGLYLSAWQSHLWNHVLASWLRETLSVDHWREVKLRTTQAVFPERLDPETVQTLRALHLPLPSSRWKPAPDDPRLPRIEKALAEEGVSLKQMQIRGVRELFFSRGERSALCPVEESSHSWGEDEKHSGKLKLTIRFQLQRGSYATLVVKAIMS